MRIMIFILLSIKTRIETLGSNRDDNIPNKFLSYYPLKQGLKQRRDRQIRNLTNDFYPTIH